LEVKKIKPSRGGLVNYEAMKKTNWREQPTPGN
jgi:hypothetical protein